jgi:HEAT repeat protein
MMAEAAAMALAAEITERLNLNNINFLSDNQQLVQYSIAQILQHRQNGRSSI